MEYQKVTILLDDTANQKKLGWNEWWITRNL